MQMSIVIAKGRSVSNKVSGIAHIALPVAFVTLIGYVASVCHHVH